MTQIESPTPEQNERELMLRAFMVLAAMIACWAIIVATDFGFI